MKSLEIVNNLINYMESVGETYDFTNISKKDCKQIKQDLDVLEILKKYYLPKNWNGFQIFTSKEETKFEDLQKVKQWLEEKDEEESL